MGVGGGVCVAGIRAKGNGLGSRVVVIVCRVWVEWFILGEGFCFYRGRGRGRRGGGGG